MATTKTLTKGDHTKFSTTIKNRDTGTVVDFTGGSASFIYRFDRGPWYTETATETSAASGIAKFQWLPNGIPKHGLLEYYFRVTDVGGHPYSGDVIQEKVVRRGA